MKKVDKPGQLLYYQGKLCEVIAIGDGRTLHLEVLKDSDKEKCPHCGEPIYTEYSVLEHSPLFQNDVVFLREEEV